MFRPTTPFAATDPRDAQASAHLPAFTEPLAAGDRAVLARRATFLFRLMRWLYACVAVVTVLWVLKLGLSRPDPWFAEIGGPLQMGGLLGATVVGVHALLARWERRLRRALEQDLAQGVKVCAPGLLETVDEGEEGGATWMKLRTGEGVQEFALRSLSDLWRIRPQRLVGQWVVIEYAPQSGLVLAAHASVTPATAGEGSVA